VGWAGKEPQLKVTELTSTSMPAWFGTLGNSSLACKLNKKIEKEQENYWEENQYWGQELPGSRSAKTLPQKCGRGFSPPGSSDRYYYPMGITKPLEMNDRGDLIIQGTTKDIRGSKKEAVSMTDLLRQIGGD